MAVQRKVGRPLLGWPPHTTQSCDSAATHQAHACRIQRVGGDLRVSRSWDRQNSG